MAFFMDHAIGIATQFGKELQALVSDNPQKTIAISTIAVATAMFIKDYVWSQHLLSLPSAVSSFNFALLHSNQNSMSCLLLVLSLSWHFHLDLCDGVSFHNFARFVVYWLHSGRLAIFGRHWASYPSLLEAFRYSATLWSFWSTALGFGHGVSCWRSIYWTNVRWPWRDGCANSIISLLPLISWCRFCLLPLCIQNDWQPVVRNHHLWSRTSKAHSRQEPAKLHQGPRIFLQALYGCLRKWTHCQPRRPLEVSALSSFFGIPHGDPWRDCGLLHTVR